MANQAVAYAGPDGALTTLAATLRKRYGDPARTYEFVTGYDRNGITSHNADANGRAHAIDIFVGPGNLSEAQGIDLAERLRSEGKRGKIPGHPDRLAYLIHRGRIAGDHTDWEWTPYTGADWHGDHIHVSSVFDYYWGDPVPGNPADYDSTADWDLWESEFTKPQGSKPTLEETLAKLDQDDYVNIARAVWGYRNPSLEKKRDAYAITRDIDARTRDWSFGVPGFQTDGYAAKLLRRALAKLGVPITAADETARKQAGVGK